MNRIVLTVCLIVPGLLQPIARAAAAERLPNIIYLMADDLGYGELGCYGQKWIKTPNIDRIAHEGILFRQHYCGNAVCATSRCCLMTGKHTGHAYIRSNGAVKSRPYDPDHGLFRGNIPIPDSEITVAEVLKQKQYATAAIGKWGLGYEGSTGDPNRQGFDLFYGYLDQRHAHNHYPRFLWRNGKKEILPGNDRTFTGKTYSEDRFREVALEFIRKNKNRPFFLYVPFIIPHLSIQVPEKSLAQYKGKIPETPYRHHGYLKPPYPHAGYAAMISHMDRDIGRIMALVKDLGLDDNTLIIFTSDNGPTYDRLGGSDSEFFHSAGPLRGFKGSLYEGGIRIPMVARWPGKIRPGSVTDLISAFWDVMPTLAEITGTKAPAGIDGISFAPTLFGQPKKQKLHEFLYWEFPSYRGQQALRMGDWKADRQNMLRRNNKHPLKIELYNLKTDIGEQHDVAADHPEIVARMRTILKQQHTPSKVFPFRTLDGPVRRRR